MSAEGGLVLMIIGALSLLWSVTARVATYRRLLQATVETFLNPGLRDAFPPPPIALELQRMVAEADAALNSDELTRQRRRWLRRR